MEDLNALQEQFDKLNSAVAALQQTIVTVNESVNTTAQKANSATNQTAGVFTNNIRTLDSLTRKLQEYTREVSKLGSSTDKVKTSLASVSIQKLTTALSKLQSALKSLDTGGISTELINLQNSIKEFDASNIGVQLTEVDKFLQGVDTVKIKEELASLQNSLEGLNVGNVGNQISGLQNSLEGIDVNSLITQISQLQEKLSIPSLKLFDNSELQATQELLKNIQNQYGDVQSSANAFLRAQEEITLERLRRQQQNREQSTQASQTTGPDNSRTQRTAVRQEQTINTATGTSEQTQNRTTRATTRNTGSIPSTNDNLTQAINNMASKLEEFLVFQRFNLNRPGASTQSTDNNPSGRSTYDISINYTNQKNTLQEALAIKNILSDQLKYIEGQNAERTLTNNILNRTVRDAFEQYATTKEQLATEITTRDILKDQERRRKDLISLSYIQQNIIAKDPEHAFELAENFKNAEKNIEEVNVQAREHLAIIEEINSKGWVKTFDIISDITKKVPGLSKISGPMQEAAVAVRKAAAENMERAERRKKAEENIIALGKEQDKLNSKQASLQDIINQNRFKGLKFSKENLKQLKLEEITQGKTGRSARKALQDEVKRISAQKGSNAQLIKGAQTIKNSSKGVSLMGAGFKALGPIIRGALGPVGLILMVVDAVKMLIQMFIKANEQTITLARNLNISRESARAVRNEFIRISRAAGETYITVDNLIKAQSELTDQLQRGGRASDQTLRAQLFLTERMKMNGAEAAKITARSEALGESSEKVVENIMAENAERTKAGKSVLTQKQLLTAVSKVSGQIAASFGFSNKAIADGIIRVRQFGLNLTQAQSIASGLLDFETSISNELEAELLTGRQLNLERARLKAATGDIAGATEDVMRQMKDLTAEQRKSPIIMKALAGVIGLSTDELQDAYLLETDITRQAEERLKREEQLRKVYKLSGEEAAQRYLNEMGMKQSLMEEVKKTVTLEEQYQEALAKVKDLFVGLVNDGVIDILANSIRALAEGISRMPFMGEIQAKQEAEQLIDKTVITETGEKTKIDSAKVKELQENVETASPWLMALPGIGAGIKLSKDYDALQAQIEVDKLTEKYGKSVHAFTEKSLKEQGYSIEKYQELYSNAYERTLFGSLFGFGEASRKAAQKQLSDLQSKLDVKTTTEDSASSKSNSNSLYTNGEAKLNDFTIRSHPKDTLVMAGGTRFGEETNALLKELIAAVNRGGDVYMDGNKVGQALVLSTSKLS